MLRALFEKKGQAVWISHLDLMRLFQRAFKRAGLALTHTQGYNPRPSVSIALPLSVGVQSHCELLDFELEGEAIPCNEIKERLNSALVGAAFARSAATLAVVPLALKYATSFLLILLSSLSPLSFSSLLQILDPALQFILGRAGAKALPVQPGAAAGVLLQILGAVADTAAA